MVAKKKNSKRKTKKKSTKKKEIKERKVKKGVKLSTIVDNSSDFCETPTCRGCVGGTTLEII